MGQSQKTKSGYGDEAAHSQFLCRGVHIVLLLLSQHLELRRNIIIDL